MMQTRLPNGDFLTAISDPARAEMDPLEALDQLEQAFRLENAVPTVRDQGNTPRADAEDMRSPRGPGDCIRKTAPAALRRPARMRCPKCHGAGVEETTTGGRRCRACHGAGKVTKGEMR